MPFKSVAQRHYMFAEHPKTAKEFAAATPKGAKLPMHVAKKKPRKVTDDQETGEMTDDETAEPQKIARGLGARARRGNV